jgi:hypothetical protein
MAVEPVEIGPSRRVRRILTGAVVIVLALGGLAVMRSANRAASTGSDVKHLAQQSQSILRELRASEHRMELDNARSRQTALCFARAQAEGLAAAISLLQQPLGSLGRFYATLRFEAAGKALDNVGTLCPQVLPVTPPSTTTPPGEGTGTSGSGAASIPFSPA